MAASAPDFELHLAEAEADIAAAQRLRYAVFVEELGGDGPLVDHEARREADAFDPHSEHLILKDRSRGGEVVGAYRLLTSEGARAAGGFYSAAEFDLAPLTGSGRSLLELGRSCLHPDYRGGSAMFELWSGLARLVEARGIEVLFGVASFHGTDTAALVEPLSLLHHRHLAPEDLRVTARPPGAVAMDSCPAAALDTRRAMLAVPALIKAYLRLGGFVGQGAWVDRAFNTTDVCMIMDTSRLDAARRRIYSRPTAR